MSTIKANSKQQALTYEQVSGPIDKAIATSWLRIAPCWPLKNLIAVNPLAGFEDLPFVEALKLGQATFQQQELPQPMQQVNRASIKWLQVFFDEGQATLPMPLRQDGLLNSVLRLLVYDNLIIQNDRHKKHWLITLPKQPKQVIAECLFYLGVTTQEYETFLTLMLATLAGWSSYIQYLANWAYQPQTSWHNIDIQTQYLALRLVFTCLHWPNAKELLSWHQRAKKQADVSALLQQVNFDETTYHEEVLSKLKNQTQCTSTTQTAAQLVFCIDVRSEPFRRVLEAQGHYETFGCAGFFGLPVAIEDPIDGSTYASCPALLKPAHQIAATPVESFEKCKQASQRAQLPKKLYQSSKYTFTVPFVLVEALGLIKGLWMACKSITPRFAFKLKTKWQAMISKNHAVTFAIDAIPFTQQVEYTASLLKSMGLTANFAPLVVFCGHGSSTSNNAYATALDCGACGGNHGTPNARILVSILNNTEIRSALKQQDIHISPHTHFIAAHHNTTTDVMTLFETPSVTATDQLATLKQDLEAARIQNNMCRIAQLKGVMKSKNAVKHTDVRSYDWAQVRPEWGLANNAAFIIGPRSLSKDIALDGRVFLHSYDWQQDPQGDLLAGILTAPVVVAQWINA